MKEVFSKLKIYQYYILIIVVSLLCLFVLPFMGSAVDMEPKIPNTTAGWIVWIIGNVLTSILALVIFHCFIKQAKVNIQDNIKFKEAQEILAKNKDEKYAPRSPHKFFFGEYGKKGVALLIGSLTAMVGLTNAVLNFDLIVMLSFLAVVVNSIVFGVIEMNNVEDFWTNEYWDYAKMIEKEKKEESQNENK